MENKRIYAIETETYYRGVLMRSGVVGIFSSKKKGKEALNMWRENVRGFNAEFTEDEEFSFTYHYDTTNVRKNISYSYRIMWYELNDATLTQYDKLLPKIEQ